MTQEEKLTPEELVELRDKLIIRRRLIFDRNNLNEEEYQQLQERRPEIEEEAKKLTMAQLIERLDDRAKGELEQIDLALVKMARGTYGVCESCGRTIRVKRLRVMPEARLDIGCARKYEVEQRALAPAQEEIERPALERRELTDDQLQEEIIDRLSEEGRVDQEGLSIYVRQGVVYLDGVIPDDHQRQLIMRIVSEEMGFASVVDMMEIWKEQ